MDDDGVDVDASFNGLVDAEEGGAIDIAIDGDAISGVGDILIACIFGDGLGSESDGKPSFGIAFFCIENELDGFDFAWGG